MLKITPVFFSEMIFPNFTWRCVPGSSSRSCLLSAWVVSLREMFSTLPSDYSASGMAQSTSRSLVSARSILASGSANLTVPKWSSPSFSIIRRKGKTKRRNMKFLGKDLDTVLNTVSLGTAIWDGVNLTVSHFLFCVKILSKSDYWTNGTEKFIQKTDFPEKLVVFTHGFVDSMDNGETTRWTEPARADLFNLSRPPSVLEFDWSNGAEDFWNYGRAATNTQGKVS